MKKNVRKINDFFISIILAIFYFLIIGVIAIVLKSITRDNNQNKSYWKKPSLKTGSDYFESAY